MRMEKDVLNELTRWASQEPGVRAMILTGSRAGDRAMIDLLSDYDIEVVVESLPEFKVDQWLASFGKIAASFSEDTGDRLSRLVLYKDGVRIDFQIYNKEAFTRRIQLPIASLELDAGWRALIDKDSVVVGLAPATRTRFRILPPSRKEYDRLINDFWWDSTYVAKSLWRDELFYAKYMLDSMLRNVYLKTLIDWYIGVKNDWMISPGKQGRLFKKTLDAGPWSGIEATYCGGDPMENWESLFAMTRVFGMMAKQVGKQQHFDYPQHLEDWMLIYLLQIKRLDKQAKDLHMQEAR